MIALRVAAKKKDLFFWGCGCQLSVFGLRFCTCFYTCFCTCEYAVVCSEKVAPDHSYSSALSDAGPSFFGGQTDFPSLFPSLLGWRGAELVLFHSLSTIAFSRKKAWSVFRSEYIVLQEAHKIARKSVFYGVRQIYRFKNPNI